MNASFCPWVVLQPSTAYPRSTQHVTFHPWKICIRNALFSVEKPLFLLLIIEMNLSTFLIHRNSLRPIIVVKVFHRSTQSGTAICTRWKIRWKYEIESTNRDNCILWLQKEIITITGENRCNYFLFIPLYELINAGLIFSEIHWFHLRGSRIRHRKRIEIFARYVELRMTIMH